MSQADLNIPNSTGFDFRQNINAALLALVTQFSSGTEPGVTYPGMVWIDTSAGGEGVHRIRNQGNNAWIDITDTDQTARDAAAAANANAATRVLKAGDTMAGPLAFDVPGVDIWSSIDGGSTYAFRHELTNTGLWRPAANGGVGDWAWRYHDDGNSPELYVYGALESIGTNAGLLFRDRNPNFSNTYQLYGNGGIVSFRSNNRDIWSVEAATGLVTMQRRPMFGTATPWDSENFTPHVYPNDATKYLDGTGNFTTPPKITFPGGTTAFLRADGTFAVPAGTGGGGAAAWGGISGDITTQTDLQAALALKAPLGNVVTLDGTQTITGGKTFAGIVNSTGFDIWRSAVGRTGLIFRDDGSTYYWLQTDPDDAQGPWNGLRPLTWAYALNTLAVIDNKYTFSPTEAIFKNPLSVTGNITQAAGYLIGSPGLGVKLDLNGTGAWLMGLQLSRTYFRIPSAGAWNFYAGGVHSDASDDPGAGGALIAQIDGTGNLRARDLYAKRADGGGAVFFGDQATGGSKYIFFDAAKNGWEIVGGALANFLMNIKAPTFIAQNSGNPKIGAFYFGDQSDGERCVIWDGAEYAFTGAVRLKATSFLSSLYFYTSGSSAVLATGVAGAVVLRPNGPENPAGEFRVTSDGTADVAAGLRVGGTIVGKEANLVIQLQADGGIFFRPKSGSDVNQMIYDYSGNLAVANSVYSTSYQMRWANSATNYVRTPRIFVQATDPGAAAQDGDLWIA